MSPIFIALIAGDSSVDAAFSASARAHAALRRFHAEAEVESFIGGRRARVQHDIVSDGSTVRLRTREGKSKGRGRTDITFLFRGNEAIGYDAVSNERLVREIPDDGRPLPKIVYTLGPVDEVIKFLIAPRLLADYYGKFRVLSGWKVKSNASGTTLTRDVKVRNGRNVTNIHFAPKTWLVTDVSLRSPEAWSAWHVKYSPPIAPTISIPTSSSLVTAFTVTPEPPKFATRRAQSIADAMKKAYAGLNQGRISVRDDLGLSQIVINDRHVREENATGRFAFDGTTLSVYNARTRKFFRGNCRGARVLDYLAFLRVRPDSLTRQVLAGHVPYQEIFTSDVTVKDAGSLEMGGSKLDVLELVRSRIRVTLFIRQSDHLLDSASTNTFDGNGRMLLTTARRFTYSNLRKSEPISTFRLSAPRGVSVSALPALPKARMPKIGG